MKFNVLIAATCSWSLNAFPVDQLPQKCGGCIHLEREVVKVAVTFTFLRRISSGTGSEDCRPGAVLSAQ